MSEILAEASGAGPVACPRCGGTEFTAFLTVRVSIVREDGEYVCRWEEGVDFEASCAACGAELDPEAENLLYEEMEIRF